MLIHSVSPAHMLVEQTQLPEVKYREEGGRYLEGVDTPEGFRLSRVHSTNPADYLRKDYVPGSIVNRR